MVLRGCRDLNLELDFGRLLTGLSKMPGATLRLRVKLSLIKYGGKGSKSLTDMYFVGRGSS